MLDLEALNRLVPFQMSPNIELLNQGAEGRLYAATWLGREVVVKQRFAKRYRHPALDAHITRERLRAEARALVRCRAMGVAAPALYDVNLEANELVLQRLSSAAPVRRAIADAAALEPLARAIGRTVAALHGNHLIHGDLTTSNMLLEVGQSDRVYMIDFGLSFVSEQAEDKAVDLYVLERAVLSTHPRSEAFVEAVLEAYGAGGGGRAAEVLARLKDVRSRGRKKLCFG